jgi:hypothetical protein
MNRIRLSRRTRAAGRVLPAAKSRVAVKSCEKFATIRDFVGGELIYFLRA